MRLESKKNAHLKSKQGATFIRLNVCQSDPIYPNFDLHKSLEIFEKNQLTKSDLTKTNALFPIPQNRNWLNAGQYSCSLHVLQCNL